MSDTHALEHRRKELLTAVERRALALKLSSNRDFKKLILDEFCVNECARYAQLSGDPRASAEERADSLALSQSAGHLRRWLSVTVQLGDIAVREIEDIDDALDEIRAEEDAPAPIISDEYEIEDASDDADIHGSDLEAGVQ